MNRTFIMRTGIIALIFLVSSFRLLAVDIQEGTYQHRPHFIITTETCTYYFDKAGGGFSRMIDLHGNDWIAYKSEPWDKAPESAASSYRGIPNAVFKGDDGGCGHPGFNQAISVKESTNSIHTISKSEKWEWRWTFYEDYAIWELLKIDTSRQFWLLFEGPIGGSYQPSKSYWGNSASTEPLYDRPNHLSGEHISGNWQWAYFGRNDRKSTLFIAQLNKDDVADFFSYMGNSADGIKAADGMVVFGFGRAVGSKPLLKETNRYLLGFWNTKISNVKRHHSLTNFISEKISQLNAGK